MISENKKLAIPLLIVFVFCFFTVTLWIPKVIKAAKNEVTITGEVIDSSCYIKMGAKGTDHKECAMICVKAGIPLALLEDKTGMVYMLASNREFESSQVKFQPLENFVAHKVMVKGKLYEKGGQKLLEISSVEKVK
ncbi:MAG: hypothetical protein HYR55_04910 [Acidobacteria bacterium]|nr:hypothetical protein [Acidobacteriota bacterium]MBI3658516.1 hypothetical protein [Acidobacteriota bacterium]